MASSVEGWSICNHCGDLPEALPGAAIHGCWSPPCILWTEHPCYRPARHCSILVEYQYLPEVEQPQEDDSFIMDFSVAPEM